MTDPELRALHAHKADPDEWDEAPADISVRSSGGEVVSFRMPTEELDRLQQAAGSEGVTLSQFIRDALNDKLDRRPESTLADVSSGLVKLILGDEWPRRKAFVSAAVEVPPYPLASQNVTSSEGAPHLDTDQDRLPLDA